MPSSFPKITIVTPSYNQGVYLEETIRSVIRQGYPSFEYIVLDGGSTDSSPEILRKYERHFAYCISQKDNGQADAISRGFSRATGDILGWVNSDDYLLPGALARIGQFFTQNPETDLAIGGGIVVDAGGGLIRKYYSFPQSFDSLLVGGQFFMQPSSFWRRSAYEAVGGLDTSLHFCFDYDLFLRLTRIRAPGGIAAMLAAFRIHEQSKTSTIWNTVALPELEQIREHHNIGQLQETKRRQLYARTVREYYLITRRGIILDCFHDPSYFVRCVQNKLAGRPGSPLVVVSPEIDSPAR